MKIGWVGKQLLDKADTSKNYCFDVWKIKGNKTDWGDDYPPVKVVILTWEEYQELKNTSQNSRLSKDQSQWCNDLFKPLPKNLPRRKGEKKKS